MPAWRFAAISVLLLCAGWWGCGNHVDPHLADWPAVVPAEGVVKYNVQPLDGATVVFSPTAGGEHGGSALTGADGKFVISAFPPDPGAVPGSYKVSVTKMSIPATPEVTAESHDAEVPPTEAPKPLIPEQYADPARSGLTADIPQAGKQDLVFELKD
jgi:hypothetical protein